MALKKNIAVNFIAQIYIAGIGIIVTPIYLKSMGAEAYGLVSIFTLIQSLFNILDLGLTPTLARETARTRGNTANIPEYFSILNSIEKIFLIIAISGGISLTISTNAIANLWLNIVNLAINDVQIALSAIAISVCFRWMAGLYRATITGFEEFQWLGYWNIFIATLRFIIVIPILNLTNGSFISFFAYQTAVAFIELYGLIKKSRILIKENFGQNNKSLKISHIESIRPLLGFSGGVAFTSVIWVLTTQTDKIILSKLLTLSDYGYFSIGALLASGITLLAGPITSTAIPKLALFHSVGNTNEMRDLYKKITQYTCAAVVPVTFILCFYHTKIIEIWTGDLEAAEKSGMVLAYYAAGNCLMTLASLPLLLQYAEGKLKLHVIGNIMYAFILYPLLLWSVEKFGIIGACWSWLGINIISFVLWTPIVHKNFFNKEHLNWLWNDVAKLALPSFIFIFLAKIYIPMQDQKALDGLIITIIYVVALCLSLLCSNNIRRVIFPNITK